MDSIKYIGLDVHKETIAIAVMNAAGKLVNESIIETKAKRPLALSWRPTALAHRMARAF
jgi:hypothetical protein